jgi:thiamine biosynthesis protein ThiS
LFATLRISRIVAVIHPHRVPTLTLHGENRAVSASTVAMLIRDLGLDPKQVAVERNHEIVPRARHEAVTLHEGDTLEVVTFVGGG